MPARLRDVASAYLRWALGQPQAWSRVFLLASPVLAVVFASSLALSAAGRVIGGETVEPAPDVVRLLDDATPAAVAPIAVDRAAITLATIQPVPTAAATQPPAAASAAPAGPAAPAPTVAPSPTATTASASAPAPAATAPATPAQPAAPAPPVGGYLPGDAYNCSDFATYALAKAYFDAVPGDPSRLDNNRDGIPCESLPGAPR